MATIDDFQKLEIRVGIIVNVEEHGKARKPMYVLKIDFGKETGMRTIVAGIKEEYTEEELLGLRIACLLNIDAKAIAGIESQGMILAAEDASGKIAVLTTSKPVEAGSKVR